MNDPPPLARAILAGYQRLRAKEKALRIELREARAREEIDDPDAAARRDLAWMAAALGIAKRRRDAGLSLDAASRAVLRRERHLTSIIANANVKRSMDKIRQPARDAREQEQNDKIQAIRDDALAEFLQDQWAALIRGKTLGARAQPAAPAKASFL